MPENTAVVPSLPPVRDQQRPRSRAASIGAALALVFAALLTIAVATSSAAEIPEVNLAKYKRVGRYDLPEPTRTTPPAHSLLAQEASAVTLRLGHRHALRRR
jgi:hypothetical protein